MPHAVETRIIKAFILVAVPITVLLVLLIFGGVELQSRMTASPFFSVHKVEVLNEGPADKKDILEVAAVPRGRNIFLVDLEKIKQNVEKNPWVHTATISRSMPDKIVIQYEAHTPVAILNAGSMYYLNKDGQAFYKISKGDSLSYPLINMEEGSFDSENNVDKERVLHSVEVLNWASKAKMIKAQDIGDLSIHGSGYKGATPISLTLSYPPSSFMNKTKLKRRLITVTMSDKDIDAQMSRVEPVLQNLMQQGINPRLIRLELGKKVVVKIAQ